MDRRTQQNDVVTPRRSFFTRIAASAMAIGLTGVDCASTPRPALRTDRTGLAHSRGGTVRWWMPTRRTMGCRSRLPLRSWRQTDQRARASSRRPRWWSCATRPSRSRWTTRCGRNTRSGSRSAFLIRRLRTSVATSESDGARAPCGDLTRGDRIPGMALRPYAGRHDRHASNSTKVGVRRLETR